MTVTITNSNHAKYQIGLKKIDFENDTFKMILMKPTFIFDKDTHATLSNVTKDQIATGNGYTQNSITLTNPSASEDDTNDRFIITWNNVTVTASGGAIEDFSSVIVYDDTTADDTIIYHAALGTTVSLTAGLSFIANSLQTIIA